MNKFVVLACAAAVTLSACTFVKIDDKKKKDPGEAVNELTDNETPPHELFKRAQDLEKTNPTEAVKLYSMVAGRGDNFTLHKAAILARARVLMDMRDFEAAMSSLTPLSENPQTLFDCRKLAMASRLLMSQGDFIQAESLMEVAVDNVSTGKETEIFRAEAFATLGKIYIQNKKSDRALTAFRIAGDLYTQNNFPEQAKACKNIAEFIAQP